MESNQNLLNSELQIDSIAHAHLSGTAKWANFLSIVGFILSVIIAIGALFAGTILGTLGNSFGGSFIGAGFIMVVYLIIAALYFFMSLYLYRFASKMKAALYAGDQESLNNSFLNLKNLYKLMGILTIVYLSFIALALILGIAGAAMR
ncbi:MAG: DUF5362 family protein [Ferruginibacter sp.]